MPLVEDLLKFKSGTKMRKPEDNLEYGMTFCQTVWLKYLKNC